MIMTKGQVSQDPWEGELIHPAGTPGMDDLKSEHATNCLHLRLTMRRTCPM
jgi:hypothetical protein